MVKKLLSSLLIGAMLYSAPLFGQIKNNITKITEDVGKKYAVIFAPETHKEREFYDSTSFDGGTKNVFLISTANIYSSLKEMGYDSNNIKVLYGTDIDTTETLDYEKIKLLKDEKFKSKDREKASLENLKSTLEDLTNKISSKDTFTFVLYDHGINERSSTVYVYDENKDSKIYAEDIQEWVKDIKAENQLYVFDTCYSGKFGLKIGNDNRIVLSSSTDYSPAIFSRLHHFSRLFFNSTTNSEADLNKDEEISISEAFNYTQKMREPILKEHEKNHHFAIYKYDGFLAQNYNLLDNDFTLFKGVDKNE